MKDTFARHGVPTELVSDNGSQYISKQFKKFAKEWDFCHDTSSPRYPQSNGLAESSVKTVKLMMKKCLATGKDIQQGLLAIRNTPLACGASPAELLMNRQLNDNLPRVPASTNTNQPPKRRPLMEERNTQKHHHDRKILTKTKPETFRPGQQVAIQDHVTKEWSIHGRIVEQVAPRSYTIQRPGKQKLLRRNSRQIRKLFSTTSTFSTKGNTHTYEQQHHHHHHQQQQQQHHQQQHQLDNDQHQLQPDELLDEQLSDNSYESDTDTIPYDDNDTCQTMHEGQQTTRFGRLVHSRRPMDYADI